MIHFLICGEFCCWFLWKKRQTAVQSSTLDIGNNFFQAAVAASTTALAAACWLPALHTIVATCSLLSTSQTYIDELILGSQTVEGDVGNGNHTVVLEYEVAKCSRHGQSG